MSERNERNKLYVRFLKATGSCADCGTKDDLTFDHLPGFEKIGTVSDMVHRVSLSKLQREIAKCEIVCWRCHMIRENGRGRTQHKID